MGWVWGSWGRGGGHGVGGWSWGRGGGHGVGEVVMG